MNPLEIKRRQLKNGLRIVTVHLNGFHTVTNFLVVRSGSRYEDKANNGIAHFLEHMVFKGTKSYPTSLEVALAIEGIGGYFNAWTANDHTCYWNTVPTGQWRRGMEVPFELAFRPLLRAEDLEKERGVIIEEIKRIQDDPARYVDDLFGQAIFKDHPLGQMIIGTEKNVESMTLEQFHSYRDEHYAPSQALFIAIGDVADKPIFEEVEKLAADLVAKKVSQPVPFKQPSERNLNILNKATDQAHLMIGVANPAYGLKTEHVYTAHLLNAILGRGMSSRLFLNIRERRGLAYAIRSFFSTFEDVGVFSVYGGLNVTKMEEALAAINEELERLIKEPVTEAELQNAKAQLLGSYDLASDEPIELAKWYGTEHLLGLEDTFEEAKFNVSKVTAKQVQAVAGELFKKERLSIAAIGPFKNEDIFKRFLGL